MPQSSWLKAGLQCITLSALVCQRRRNVGGQEERRKKKLEEAEDIQSYLSRIHIILISKLLVTSMVYSAWYTSVEYLVLRLMYTCTVFCSRSNMATKALYTRTALTHQHTYSRKKIFLRCNCFAIYCASDYFYIWHPFIIIRSSVSLAYLVYFTRL